MLLYQHRPPPFKARTPFLTNRLSAIVDVSARGFINFGGGDNFLVGGFNPFEKYESKWVHLPQGSG